MMMKAKLLPYICLPFLLITTTNVVAQAVETYITDEDGVEYLVPAGYNVYIAPAPAFTLENTASGDMNFIRLSSINEEQDPVTFVVPDEPVEPECKIDGPIMYDPEMGEWRFCGGDGWVVGGPEQQWAAQQYNGASASFRDSIGDYSQYSGSSAERLRSLLTGNGWWYTRLQRMAEAVMAGDDSRFYIEFRGTDDDMKSYALEVLNRYIALLNDGYTADEINAYVWGGE